MGKTRDLFKKIRDTRGTFHAKMGSIKDRNGMDLTEAEDIKRWQEYIELQKRSSWPSNHIGVITHLEPDILECKVKWALGSITTNKTSGGDGIPVELFQILKDDAVKVLHSICQQIWKTAVATGLEKVSFHSNRKGNAKECSNYCTIALISMAPHSSTLAWKIPWTEEPGRLQSMGSLGVGHDWATSLWLFTFMHWRRKWQPTPVFLPGESQGRGSLVGCCLWGRTESDTTEAT